jgi:hypothetical protein
MVVGDRIWTWYDGFLPASLRFLIQLIEDDQHFSLDTLKVLKRVVHRLLRRFVDLSLGVRSLEFSAGLVEPLQGSHVPKQQRLVSGGPKRVGHFPGQLRVDFRVHLHARFSGVPIRAAVREPLDCESNRMSRISLLSAVWVWDPVLPLPEGV